MSHSRELVESILALVQVDYPPSLFSYTIEKAIPGTRMHPDILVSDPDGQLKCAVEIGYTRPEKLTAYRNDLKIPDVRWYDKSGNLHADVQERVIRVHMESEPSGQFIVYRVNDNVECRSEICEYAAAIEWNLDIEDLDHTMTQAEEDDMFCRLLDSLALDVSAIVITDYFRMWLCCFCDKCGEPWVAGKNDSIDTEAIAYDLTDYSPREFARIHGSKLMKGSWAEVTSFVENYIGIKPDFDECDFLSIDCQERFEKSMKAVWKDVSADIGSTSVS